MTGYGSIAETHFGITLLGKADRHARITNTQNFKDCQLLRRAQAHPADPQLPHWAQKHPHASMTKQVRFQHLTVRLFVGCPLTVGGAAPCKRLQDQSHCNFIETLGPTGLVPTHTHAHAALSLSPSLWAFPLHTSLPTVCKNIACDRWPRGSGPIKTA